MTGEVQNWKLSGGTASEIAASLEVALVRGELMPGQQLPSVRQVAGDLGVSPSTVASALRELRHRGLIVTRQRHRSFVSRRPPVATALSLRLPAGARDLANGNPDPELMPDLEAAVAALDLPLRLYGDEPTLDELVTLARVDFDESGIGGDEVCVVSGALDGMERVLGAHLGPGERVAVEDPGYSAQFDLLRAMGLLPIPVPIDEYGFLPGPLGNALLDGVQAVVITPRAQNPTGAALDASRALDLRVVLGTRPEVLVIENDHQAEVSGVAPQTTTSDRRRWAVVRSISKSLGPDLRIAFVTGDALTISRVEGRQVLGPGWVSHVLQRLALALWSSPEVRQLLERAEAVYRDRREVLLRSLENHGVSATGRSGFNVWIPVAEESVVLSTLLQHGWVVAAGAPSRIASPPAIRITTASLQADEAEALVIDIARTVAPRRLRRAA